MNNPAKQPESYEKAYEYAVFLLSLKLRTVGEIREKMGQKRYVPGVIDKVLETLHSNHYLDDRRYAEVYLENLKKYKNFGYYGIKKKFMERRLPNSLIEAVLSEGLPVEEERKIAERFLKKERVPAKADSQEARQKIARRLQSRGFRSEVVSKFLSS